MTEKTEKLRSGLPYRPNVGLVLINPDGLVFAGRRIDQTVESWQMPQGGIDGGETPEGAALRELKEETGTDKASIIRMREDWLNYDLPDHLIGVALHGKYRGQSQKWIALRFEGQDADIVIATAEPEFDQWKWLKADTLMSLIVPFKREIYQQVFTGFSDLLA